MTVKKRQKMDRLSDRQLVDLLLANEEAAVEYVFFERCDGIFSHVISSIFHDTVKKEELITEFYLYLQKDDWRRLRQFSFRSKLETWLTVVAVRFFKEKSDAWTNNVMSETLISEEAQQVLDDFDLLDELSKLELYEAVERHPKPRERFALLGWLAGEKAETLAKELGCSVMAVYNLTKKAKLSVKNRMKGRER